MANLLLVSGLALLDVFPVVVPPAGWRPGRPGLRGGSAGGAFAMGAASGLVAAPCGAPAFAAVLTFVAATGSAVLGFALPAGLLARADGAAGAVGSRAAPWPRCPGRADGPSGSSEPAASCCRHGGVLPREDGWRPVRAWLPFFGLPRAAPRGRRALRQPRSRARLGTRAPAVVVQDLDGKPVDLGQYIGKKPVLLEFWATWCEICEALLPTVRAAQAAVRRPGRVLRRQRHGQPDPRAGPQVPRREPATLPHAVRREGVSTGPTRRRRHPTSSSSTGPARWPTPAPAAPRTSLPRSAPSPPHDQPFVRKAVAMSLRAIAAAAVVLSVIAVPRLQAQALAKDSAAGPPTAVMVSGPDVGRRAPDLPASLGQQGRRGPGGPAVRSGARSRQDRRRSRSIPRDFTSGCTAEMRTFAEQYDSLFGPDIVVRRHQHRFAGDPHAASRRASNLPFRLLSDPPAGGGPAVRQQRAVRATCAGRCTWSGRTAR